MRIINKIESFIYNKLRKSPKIKNQVRNAYQLVMSVIPVKKNITEYTVTVRNGYFFGFHDKTPFSPDNKLLLAHKFNGEDNRNPGPDEWVEIGYFSGDDYLNFYPLFKTCAWNWTQGAMLQWLGNSEYIIFNDFDGKQHVSRIINAEGKIIKMLPLPVGAVSPDGKMALSYNFARLRRGMPGYGYANGSDPDSEINIPNNKESGLKLVKTIEGEIKELFSVADIAGIEPEPSMQNAFHYFTHCLFAPSGERFVFFHRWLINDDLRYTRMISCDLEGKNIFIYPTAGMVSHIAWKDNRHILAYAKTREYGDHYYLFEDQTGHFKIIGEHCFNSDGHPQFSPDGRYILTDTYPDRFRRQHLIIYDLEDNKRRDIAKLQLPLKYLKEPRCDFHPRWDRKGELICFDSAHTGIRSLCTISMHN